MSPSPTAPTRQRILVVDDHEASRYGTVRMLRAAGFETIEAATGGEALRLATANVDLIVLDVNLPDIDGFEVCRQLRTRRETAYLPVTYLSATFVNSTDIEHGLLAGADSYLTHPADPLVLTATVRALLFARDADAIKRRADARFRTVFELAPSGIAIMDADLIFMDINAAFCELTGRDRETVIGSALASYVSGPFDVELAALNTQLKELGRWDGTLPIQRADGTRREIEWRVVAEVDTGGHIAIATDITGRVRGEHERERLLESERAARAEAERSNQLKEEFLATLSHELRNPLSAILGWASLLRRTPDLPANVQHGVEAIERNARVQSHLTADLLDFAAIRFGKVRLELKAIDPNATVDAAMETVMSQAQLKKINLVFDTRSEDVSVMGDESRLQQVVWNLLSNAIKFTPEGGTVELKSRVVERSYELDVTDTGRGITPEFLPKMFERFSQQDSGSTKRYAGLGIGLSIVRHLVSLHQGTIEAFSEGEGRGSTFRVRLATTSNERDAPILPGSSALADLDLLVVEDASDARALVARLLTDAGANVREAASADAALAEIARIVPDVLISDIGMAKKDGYQLINDLRKAGYTADVLPAIALTAFVRTEDRSEALDAGFQIHLGKPVDAQALITAVRTLAAKRIANPES
jgi:PAS domain S-box-containing protein